MSNSMTNIPYSVKSLSGIIVLADGQGGTLTQGKLTATNIQGQNLTSTNISGTNISGTSITSDTHLVNGTFTVVGTEPAISPYTGSLKVQNYGIGCDGNIWASKIIHSNSYQGTTGSSAYNLYTTPNNPLGLYLGATGTPLYIQSPITFTTGKSDNFITNNIYSDLSANPTSLNIWTTNTNNPSIQIANSTTDGVQVNCGLGCVGGMSCGDNLVVSNKILSSSVQANDIYLRDLHFMDISKTSTSAGSQVGFVIFYVGGQPFKMPYYNM